MRIAPHLALVLLLFTALAACDDDEKEKDVVDNDVQIDAEVDVPPTDTDLEDVDLNDEVDGDAIEENHVPDEDEVPDVDPETEDLGTEIAEVTPDATETTDLADTPSCGYGNIHGRVCSPNGSSWLSDVEVSVSAVDCSGSSIILQDFTNAQGFYTLHNVPAGLHTIVIKTGSFTTSIPNVRVEIGRTTDLTGALTKTCLDRRAASIAVLTGTFDHVEQILDNLGVTYQLYEGDSAAHNPNSARSGLDLLANLQELLTYDILFLNCGEWYQTFTTRSPAEIQLMTDNLFTFVQSGGSIYASDWAYFWTEMAFPDIIEYYGDDSIEGNAKVGSIYENLVANVVSDSFRRALGNVDTITILFNWPAWVVAVSASLSSTVHIVAPSIQTFQSTLYNVPLVISHQPTTTSGTVFFTSFHHEAQLTSQMEQVLRFLVFQL